MHLYVSLILYNYNIREDIYLGFCFFRVSLGICFRPFCYTFHCFLLLVPFRDLFSLFFCFNYFSLLLSACLLFCFLASLLFFLFASSASSAFLLLCFFASLLFCFFASLLLCFSAFPLLLCFSVFSSLFFSFCFSAATLLRGLSAFVPLLFFSGSFCCVDSRTTQQFQDKLEVPKRTMSLPGTANKPGALTPPKSGNSLVNLMVHASAAWTPFIFNGND